MKFKERRTKQGVNYAVAIIFIAIFATIGYRLLFQSHAATLANAAPTSPPVQVCGNTGELNGPATAPAGAITVPAGDNSSAMGSSQLPANTTYYFAAGTHTLGTGLYSQIEPGSGDTFIGAPGAVINGQNDNQFAFVGNDTSVTNVTIKYLTIQNFIPPGSQGAVNTNSNDNWTIEYNTIQNNLPGAAMMVGSNNTIEYNCLTQNGEYAFNAYQDPSDPESSALTTGPQNINISDNEISYNDTCNWEAVSNFPITSPSGCKGAGQNDGCGCSGGGKFWAVDGATYEDNYVHNNYSVGMWADTNNTAFDVEGNYFANNYGEAIIYEISYNALIKNNTFIGNAVGSGPSNPGFPDSAIYVSESGGDSRVPGANSGSLDITDNVFTNNWGGVVLWENANRYCSSSANTSTGYCTLVNPSQATIATCSNATDLAKTPYINDCRWKTQNVAVSSNIFNFTPASVGTDCTTANGCGYNGLFSEYGSYAPYTGWVVPLDVSNTQNNVFSDNSYTGPWNFMGFNQGDTATWAQWSSGFDDQNGSGDHFNAQDAGSTFNSQSAPAPTQTSNPSVPSNVNAKANASTSVTVGWTASTDTGGPGVGGYYIYRNGAQIASVGASVTSYTDTSVAASSQYSYAIEAYDTASPPDVSGLSTAAAVETPGSSTSPTSPITVLPAAPTNVTATANSPTSVTVGWTASPSTSSSTTSTGTPTPDSSVSCNYQTDTWSGDASSDDYTVDELSSTNGNPASYSVKLNAKVGNTEVVGYPSTQCLLYAALPTTLTSSFNITPPSASSGLDYEYAYDIWLTTASAAQSDNWNNDLELMIWNYVNGQTPAGSVSKSTLADGSKVYVDGNNSTGTVSVVLPQNETTGTVDIASIISQLKSLGYVTSSDNGILDVEYGIEAPDGGGQTFAVNSLSLSESGSTSTSGSGTSSSIAGYYVLRNGVNLTPSMVNGTSYTDTSVVANTSYSYTVEAVGSPNTVSAQSTAATVKTPNPVTVDTTPPSQPTGVTATAASASQINLQWKASTDSLGVAGYHVYRNGTLVATVTTTSYGDTGLSASTEYSYYVVAFDGAGNLSANSGTASAKTGAASVATTVTISGTVVNATTGAALQGVYVTTGRFATASGAVDTYTNADGAYVLTGITPNKNHSYTFSLSGYHTQHLSMKVSAGTHTENVRIAPIMKKKR